MNRTLKLTLLVACCGLTCASGSAVFDDFDRIEDSLLLRLTDAASNRPHQSLSMEQVIAQPRVLRDSRSSLLLLRTNDGNLARMLISAGFRKSKENPEALLPIALIERFETFEMPGAKNRIASGRDLILFNGAELDLDLGQTVPEKQGGDLVFRTGEKSGVFHALDHAQLFVVAGLPDQANTNPGASRGRTVVPNDFAGRFRLIANGQWSGMLELKVDSEHNINGSFRSDDTGTAYRVTGKAGANSPNRLELTIEFPRAHMNIEGRLWSEGKSVFSGSASLLDRTYGFAAVREGQPFDHAKLGETHISVNNAHAAGRVRITVESDGAWKRNGEPADENAVDAALREALASDPAPTLCIEAAEKAPFQAVKKLIERARAMGPFEFELALSDEMP